ncbi:MAG: polyprenyl synthetase family protein [Candidatus Omnitrophota bacterium]
MNELKTIYEPIARELGKVNSLIRHPFRKSRPGSIYDLGTFLLASPGKRIRPALTILSAKATLNGEPTTVNHQLTRIAACVELIHMASLLHDDVIDHSHLRHNKPTINSTRGKDIAIALGDYLYSVAFELISECGNADIIHCVSCATKEMCEGELIQVCERENLDLLKERYIIIVKKKTASLFAASCQTGALISKGPLSFFNALKEYGINFGIAFQIVDDFLDLVGDEKSLGKKPGQDLNVGEMTLPVLNLLEAVPANERKDLRRLLSLRRDKKVLLKIRSTLFETDAARKTEDTVSHYLRRARKRLDILPDSTYKESLIALTGFLLKRGFGNLRKDKKVRRTSARS